MTAGQPLRVLIVDDEAPARNRIRDLLSDCALKMPIEIAGEAENGKRALAMLPGCEADVVLLDVRMPDMDGLEVAQHIQKLDEPPTVILQPSLCSTFTRLPTLALMPSSTVILCFGTPL